MSSLVPEWLGGLRLEQYCPAFQEAGLRTLWECRELNAAQLEGMGVALPGHRKRILGSLQKLFPSERGMEGEMEREKDGEDEERPVPMERTKFRPPGTVSESLVHLPQTGKLRNQSQNVASNLGAQGKAPPPIPPRQTPNRPPVPFTPTSATVATAVTPVSVSASCPVSLTGADVHMAKPVLAPATQTRPTPTPRPRPESLPLKETVPKQDKKPSPISPSVSSSPSTSSSSSSSEQFHLYEQCSSPGQAERGIPPLPPKSYSIGTPKEAKVAPPGRPPRRPPIPPRGTTTSNTTAPPKSPPTVSSSPADDLSDADRAPHVPPRPRSHQEGPKKGVPLPPSQSSEWTLPDSPQSLIETIHLQKLLELSRDNEVLVLVERGRTLYIEGERKLDFYGWASAIERAAGSSGDTLSQQQLTEADIPVIVERCIHYITQYGLTSEGIYRKSGVNSKIAALLEAFRRDARSVWLKEGEQQVDDVSNVLKRFFRDIEEGLFSQQAHNWLSTTAVSDESRRISQYQLLFNNLPRVNKATLRTLVNHLYCVQRFSELNQMNLHNLAIVFGPTLFQTDGKDYNAGRVVEDLIQHYITIFHVNEQQLKTQLDEITYIIKLRDNLNPKTGPASGDFICTVYLEEKKETAEQHVKIPATMTAAELTFEMLDRRKITVKEKDYWCCFEVNEKEEIERPLHYQERVLPILHSLGTDSHLLVKKNYSMEAMLVYLASKVDVTKHGMLKFREEKSLLGLTTGSFNDRYFMLNQTSLRLYKDVRSNRAEKEWPVKCLKVYQGIKKKLRPPTCWGLTVVYGSDKTEKQEKQQWYLCCDTQTEMREWFATFLSIQHAGLLWPAEWVKSRAASPLDAAGHSPW
ncbi:hypothetical protein AOLI_G00325340 [Acnodon oligacanthus]